jgi:hypothetical protein
MTNHAIVKEIVDSDQLLRTADQIKDGIARIGNRLEDDHHAKSPSRKGAWG